MNEVSFTSDGYVLRGHMFMASQPKPLAFLFIQGWTGHQNMAAARRLTDLGYTTMTYDMRGHGTSDGAIEEFSRADFIADACLAYDVLREQVGESVRIGVVGSSFGGYTAALLSEQRDVVCLSLRVPASYPDEGFDRPQHAQRESTGDFREWRHRPLMWHENRAFMALHNFTGFVQIIEAGRDEAVPREAVQNYVSAVADQTKLSFTVMKDAGHGLTNDRLQAEYEGLLVEWVESLGLV